MYTIIYIKAVCHLAVKLDLDCFETLCLTRSSTHRAIFFPLFLPAIGLDMGTILDSTCIRCIGKLDVYYRVHAQSYGWLGWAKNGEESGTAGFAKRLEGIQIVLVPKGGAAPANNYKNIQSVNTKAYIKK